MQYEVINKVSELPNFDRELPIFCDIETDDLYGPLRMIQFYQPQTSPTIYIVDIAPFGYNKVDYYYELRQIEDFVMIHHTVWYNSSYDLGSMNISPSMGVKHPDEVTKDTKYEHKVDDLFYAVKTAYAEFMEFGLKKIVKKLPYTKGLYDGINTIDNPKGFVRGAYISKNAFKYAAIDVYALSLIWGDKKVQLVIENNLAYKVDMMSQAYALIYQQNGLLLDRKMWEDKLSYAEEQVIKYTKMLPAGFNPNSYKQVREFLNTDKSDHEALVAMIETRPEAEYIINLKKFKKQVSYLKSIEFDRMYTKFNAAGAITGRFTSAGGSLHDHFNAQQIPRDFQKLFTQDTDDTVVIDLDYSTLELRLAAAMYGVPYMYKQFKEDRDLHIDMAVIASEKEIAPDGYPDINHRNMLPWGQHDDRYLNEQERNDAKAINFGYVFGMSAKKYVPYAFTNYGIKVTLEESNTLRKKYFSLYPELTKIHNKCWDGYKKPSFYVYTALGRKVKPKLGTDAINTPIQGSGAETTKLAVHYLVKENPLALKYIYNVVHDAIYERVPRAEKDYWAKLQADSMLKAWTEISKTKAFIYKDVPMKVE